ncbi:hypothetical protein [Mycolicibacterium moriokaense]|uniref:Intersectin-EH binding protein Ibp1 n=1 Tax=Mycolicibacterium moriokaense TaxID=39691 RepID=A0A318HKP9_9MYCO|nr:hypothetical protein [Mycolicibacterium moriokaense]PXX06624.1 hypothetical protein C8E89_113137 [Mycolicibacterium moriokaense]
MNKKKLAVLSAIPVAAITFAAPAQAEPTPTPPPHPIAHVLGGLIPWCPDNGGGVLPGPCVITSGNGSGGAPPPPMFATVPLQEADNAAQESRTPQPRATNLSQPQRPPGRVQHVSDSVGRNQDRFDCHTGTGKGRGNGM